jgi:hypothetical protein
MSSLQRQDLEVNNKQLLNEMQWLRNTLEQVRGFYGDSVASRGIPLFIHAMHVRAYKAFKKESL